MKHMSSVLLIAALLSGAAHASVVKLDQGQTQKQGVNISVGGTATVDGQSYPLTTVGSGVRLKKVFFNVKVYVAQLLMGDPSKFVRAADGALSSLDQQNIFAMHLTFLREVPMDKLVSAFEEGFAANNVNMNDADIGKFMAMVNAGGHGEEGGTLTVLIHRGTDGGETLTYEVQRSRNPYSGSMKASPGLAKKVFALWLGVPADDFLGQLKTELLQ